MQIGGFLETRREIEPGVGLYFPDYERYSFAAVMPTMLHLLTGVPASPLLPAECFPGGRLPSVSKILLLFVDSHGWSLWERFGPTLPGMRRFWHDGVVTPLSALFPSTTSASVTTAYLGVLPAQHALIEWILYLEEYDLTIETLQFSTLGGKPEDLAGRYDPALLIAEGEPLFQRFAEADVPCALYIPAPLVKSSYNRLVCPPEAMRRYWTISEALVNVAAELATQQRLFACLYYDDIDAMAHHYGPGSPQHVAQIHEFWHAFDHVFGGDQLPPDSLIAVVADHGHTPIDRERTRYLNLERPELASALRRDRGGRPILPSGSPRDLFLHVAPEHVDSVTEDLTRLLAGSALVWTAEEALDAGLFGPGPYNPVFRRRLGDLLILPRPDETVWWQEPERGYTVRFLGLHGGLSAEEMTTAFAALTS